MDDAAATKRRNWTIRGMDGKFIRQSLVFEGINPTCSNRASVRLSTKRAAKSPARGDADCLRPKTDQEPLAVAAKRFEKVRVMMNTIKPPERPRLTNSNSQDLFFRIAKLCVEHEYSERKAMLQAGREFGRPEGSLRNQSPLWQAWDYCVEKGEMVVDEWQSRRKDDIDEVRVSDNYIRKVPSALHEAIYDFIKSRIQQDVKVSGAILKTWLASQHDICMSDRQCQRYLQNICGLEFGVFQKRTPKDLSKEKDEAYTRYAYLCELEDQGQVVIVYWDQSYINRGHDIGKGWFSSELEPRKGNCRGQLLILSHALTKDGLVIGVPVDKMQTAKRGIDYDIGLRPPFDTQADLGKLKEKMLLRDKVHANCAEWTFEGKSKIKDYHQNFSGVPLRFWFEENLMPSLERRYPVPEARRLCTRH